jgi:hypothetical protein
MLMASYQPLIYKIATDPREFELIHGLNYRTFAEEIPQHAPNPERRLVDRFHEENTYIICMSNEKLLGMVALRGNRPFSLDFKLSGLDSYLPLHSKALEIRLLAIEPRHRKTTVLLGMMMRGVEVAKARGYDLALISGTTRQLKLYEHLGFKAFGPLVGTAEAQFQPMYLTWTLSRRASARYCSMASDGPESPTSSLVLWPWRRVFSKDFSASPSLTGRTSSADC